MKNATAYIVVAFFYNTFQMANLAINGNNWQEPLRNYIKQNPTETYNRIKQLWGNDFPRWINGYEKNDGSKSFMFSFIERKAIASGNPVEFILNRF
jgi:hypothetical protein